MSNSVKILVFDAVVALIALAAYLAHATVGASTAVKLLFYPVYGYTMLSFVPAAIGVVMGVLERQKGDERGRLGVWGNALYIVTVIAALVAIWVSSIPEHPAEG